MKANLSKQTLDIGEVVALSGITPATLRFYEEKKLIRSVGRNGLRRLFPAHVLEQLEFIALGQSAGLRLEEIASMFTAQGKLLVDRQFVLDKAKEIEKNIQRFSVIQSTLIHIAKCPAPNHMECPTFQRLLRVAGKKKSAKIKTKKAHS